MHGALKLDIQAPAQTKGAQAIFKELELNLGAVVAAQQMYVGGRSHVTQPSLRAEANFQLQQRELGVVAAHVG